MFVARIREIGSHESAEPYLYASQCKQVEGVIHHLVTYISLQQMFFPVQHGLIFKHQRHGKEKSEAASQSRFHNKTGGPGLTSDRRDNH